MASGDGWTEEELNATSIAYLEMLKLEQQGKPYSKAEYNAALREGALSNRSKGSIEYRMQNISAALQELSLPWIMGYKPAKNIGTNSKKKLQEILLSLGYEDIEYVRPTEDDSELEKRVSYIRSKIKLNSNEPPKGQVMPQSVSGSVSRIKRDPMVKAWVLENSQGKCEACEQDAPFKTNNDDPYLEVHHVITLADGGSDTIENAVAVCPNCHRRLHYGADKREYKKTLEAVLSHRRIHNV